MAIIHLIRHGEAAASWQQSPDPVLSERGKMQARALGEALATLPVDTILSSPLSRAQETAAPFAHARNLPVTLNNVFREIPTPGNVTLGNRLAWLQGCAHSEWRDSDIAVLNWRTDILDAMQDLQGAVVVFTHFMVMNAVLGYIRQADTLVCYQPDYCSVLSVQCTGSHLQLLAEGRQAASRIL